MYFTRTTTDAWGCHNVPSKCGTEKDLATCMQKSGKKASIKQYRIVVLDDKLVSQLSVFVADIFGGVILSRQPEEQDTGLSQFTTGWLEKCHLEGHGQYHF